MCGIAGIVGPRAVDHVSAVHRMMAAMTHRGPDGEGLYLSPSGTCVLGHRRLSILDLTDNAAQPMVDARRQHVFCYNGECYNYPELRQELTAQGETFSSTGDAQVVLRMLSNRGLGALSKLNGMFAFAFWDAKERSLLLARDRFGQKPLYYAFHHGLLIFASELRALLASELVPRKVDLQSLLNYLACGSVPGPRTIVEGIRLLPAGHYLFISESKSFSESSPCSFWSPPRDKVDASSQALAAAFAASVKRHMISDVPIGVFLSGGIDSSAIAAGAMQELGGNVNTLCVTYPDQPKECEGQHAKRVADRIGSHHVEVPVTGTAMLELARRALDAMDQPTVDGINTYVVSYAAHQAGFKVALSGLGGDELFGGYRSVFADPLRLLRLRGQLGVLGHGIATGLQVWAGNSRRAAKVADALVAPNGLLPAYLVRRRLFTSRQIQTMFPGYGLRGWFPGIPHEQFEFLSSLISDREVPDALGLMDMAQYMSQQLLRDTDVMGMAHSLEIRAPFLDAEFASLALRLPSSTRSPNAVPKHRFAEAVRDWLPSENLSRSKQGFSMPFAAWMTNELRNDVECGIEEMLKALSGANDSSIRRMKDKFLRQPDRVGWARPWALFVLGRYLSKTKLICAE